jgi:undecaprenyl diphosphate synthase
MDGNRRFGREQHAGDALQGHWAGGQRLVDCIQWCIEDGVEILTVYAFSTENWQRDTMEVMTLMTIFAKYAETFETEALQRNVRVNVLMTESDRLPPKVKVNIEKLIESTRHCTGFTVNICLSYGGRSEIVQACAAIVQEKLDEQQRETTLENKTDREIEIDEKYFASKLLTANYPDPDILIRTSGEYRLSNYLLWQVRMSLSIVHT